MSEQLLSVGLDVGTTTSQMILSELTVENRASSFAVPELEIGERKIRYRSPIRFTPLSGTDRVDAQALREMIAGEYRTAGITRDQVDTGAIIITGETSRKENARAVLAALSDFAGEFVVATAGPALESVLAAKGAGAVELSQKTERPVLHMDIGGGTSNLAWIREGKILKTGCLNVGGRLLKLEGDGTLTYVSPVLGGLTDLYAGQKVSRQKLEEIARLLVQALEMAAGLREKTALLEALWTRECGPVWDSFPEGAILSFSGGVADCLEREVPWLAYGDLGPVLGRAIGESRLCRGKYRLGEETIRATVIGAGCHSTQLSGSTVYYQKVTFPLKNIPVVFVEEPELPALRQALASQEGPAVLALKGMEAPSYGQITRLADTLAAAAGEQVLLCLETDMAKALGQALAMRLGREKPILCLDRVRLRGESYLDIGAPVGPALPVVVKTIVLGG